MTFGIFLKTGRIAPPGPERRIRRAGRGARHTAAVTGLLLLGACREADPDTMFVVETIELSDSGAWTLHAGHDSIFWVGFPGELRGVDQSGRLLARHTSGRAGIPIVSGRSSERLFFHSRDSISSVSPTGPVMTRPGRSSRDLLVDPLGRFLLGTEEDGGIIAWDADTLEPAWGWAALGATSTSIAITRAGHRVYQTVDRSGDASSPQMLVRDAQTGRVLRSVGVPIAAASIVVGDGDEAYLAGRSETGGTSVMALVWRGGEIEVAWRKSLERITLGEGAIPRLLISPDGSRLMVSAADGLSGLYLLDSASGEILGRLRDAGRDVAFAPDGGVLLLLSGEIRRLEGDQ